MTVQKGAGHRVASVFSVVHGAGRGTALFSTKAKFSLFDRSWDNAIDRFLVDEHQVALVRSARRDLVNHDRAFTFLHMSLPDQAGHACGFMSGELRRGGAHRRADRGAGHDREPPGAGPGPRRHPDRRPRRPRPALGPAPGRQLPGAVRGVGCASRPGTSTRSTGTTGTRGPAGRRTPGGSRSATATWRTSPRTCSGWARCRAAGSTRPRTSTSAEHDGDPESSGGLRPRAG